MTRQTQSPDAGSRDAEITRLAHQIWEDEGRPEGQAEAHWAEAERRLAAGTHPNDRGQVEAERDALKRAESEVASGEFDVQG